ncbi:hypothetical protein [Kitasatospora sp. NBC_01300]|uniref:hypothetical protein n=1 Tax=Kitasatospora sp. NBC_01300 TaxID=2903574 RepID=UPI00352D051C|nr:hypothetical protein OG556_37955 [Kitasatospora sp. NBC_01300]
MWAHKTLLLLPGIAGVALAGVVGVLALGVTGLWSEALAGDIALVVVAVLVVAVFATFFNAVLIVAADDALRGRPVGIGAGYGRALRRLPAIVVWALVGVVVIFFGSLLLVGIWWAMASYLVLPAMMIDGVGVREAMRTSRRAFRAHGGDSGRSSTWIALPVTLSFFPSVAVFGVGLTAADRVSGVLAMVGAALWLAVAVTVTASLSGVFRVRHYRELTGRPAPAPTLPALHVSPVE